MHCRDDGNPVGQMRLKRSAVEGRKEGSNTVNLGRTSRRSYAHRILLSSRMHGLPRTLGVEQDEARGSLKPGVQEARRCGTFAEDSHSRWFVCTKGVRRSADVFFMTC